jgi:hypothetical protein
MDLGKRNYHYRGVNPGKEQRRFWILILIALAIGAAIIYFF